MASDLFVLTNFLISLTINITCLPLNVFGQFFYLTIKRNSLTGKKLNKKTYSNQIINIFFQINNMYNYLYMFIIYQQPQAPDEIETSYLNIYV